MLKRIKDGPISDADQRGLDTILRLLGLNPSDLQAVRIEGTSVLPGIGGAERHTRDR